MDKRIYLKFIFTAFVSLFLNHSIKAQLVEVQADYNSIGDCIFSAYNNAKTPVYLNIDFADLQNTTFNESLPYIKMLTPGYNSLFTLERDMNADIPRFNYQIKSFRSNPMTAVDLDFPYLIPFAPGNKIIPVRIKNIKGFWGDTEPNSWIASGFKATTGENIYASRQGTIVEIAGEEKSGDPDQWYNTWNNCITLLQPDGTLICYRNISDKNKKLELNQKVFPGEVLGEIVPGADELIVLIYQNSLTSPDLRFIIPQFVINENEIEVLNTAKEYTVVHPDAIRGLEMTKKERRKILGTKK